MTDHVAFTESSLNAHGTLTAGSREHGAGSMERGIRDRIKGWFNNRPSFILAAVTREAGGS